MLVLDFDGVIADAFDECAAVAWLGMRPNERDGAAEDHLGRAPASFAERFRAVRPYCRTLDHFIVAHVPGSTEIADQADFDRRFAEAGEARAAAFAERATAAREAIRRRDPAAWAAMHTLYPGIAELIRGAGAPVAIVTAKDEPSVRAILVAHGLEEGVRAVLGECHDKARELERLCAEAGLDAASSVFIDDNLDNVLRVRSTGARTFWARWGYSTPEQHARAEALGVDALDLADLPGLASASRI
ncbi:HAD family hydrolase [Glycomyces tenuis]|uniref:HAD family hydrolase n=1 Tax=Glycomyces tenuis TaxID=58116 RepID=UPI0004293767|nr:HAD family hydrolase [Glycomyces tenuis]